MHYTGQIYRPPAEAANPLLQVTSGCSHNGCKFCDMFKGQQFRMSPLKEIEEDLEEIRIYRPNTHRIYLTGGDPFVLSYEKMKTVLIKIHQALPQIQTVTMTARVSNMKNKSVEQLKELHELGIDDLWLGAESGDNETLELVNKKLTAEEIVTQCRKLEDAGIRYTLSYIVGLGGRELSIQNALNSAKTYSQLKPTVIGMGGLMLFQDSILYKESLEGKFEPCSELELLKEIKVFLQNLDTQTHVSVNHTSPIFVEGDFPNDKKIILDKINYAIKHFDEKQQNRNRAIPHIQ